MGGWGCKGCFESESDEGFNDFPQEVRKKRKKKKIISQFSQPNIEGSESLKRRLIRIYSRDD